MPRTARLALSLLTSVLLAVSVPPLTGVARADEGRNVVPDVFLNASINSETFNRPNVPITAAEMATVTRINHFNAQYIKSFEGLQYATSLEVLALHGATADLSVISRLPSLEAISINSPDLSDISFLANKPNLTSLTITTGKPLDLTPVSHLTTLLALELESPAVDLNALRPLTALKSLHLATPAKDLSPLSGMTEMTELLIDDAGVTDLRPLAGMTRMDNLRLRDNAISDLSPLSSMREIQYLYLEGNTISDVRPLAALTSLRRLHLDANNIADVGPLAGLRSLEKLLVGGNRITDLSPLSPMAPRTWAGMQSVRVKAENGSRYTLPVLRDATGARVSLRYPFGHPSAGQTVPASVIVGQSDGLQRYEWEGAQFSGEFIIDVVDATYPPVAPPSKPATVDVYTTPGDHFVNGRHWRTRCEKYSATKRCTTQILATQVTQSGGRFVSRTSYVFNNLTYLPAPRSLWRGNPLATHSKEPFVIDGRTWKTECDTPVTGRNGCRSYIEARVIEAVPATRGSGYSYRWTTRWVVNNIVRFG